MESCKDKILLVGQCLAKVPPEVCTGFADLCLFGCFAAVAFFLTAEAAAAF